MLWESRNIGIFHGEPSHNLAPSTLFTKIGATCVGRLTVRCGGMTQGESKELRMSWKAQRKGRRYVPTRDWRESNTFRRERLQTRPLYSLGGYSCAPRAAGGGVSGRGCSRGGEVLGVRKRKRERWAYLHGTSVERAMRKYKHSVVRGIADRGRQSSRKNAIWCSMSDRRIYREAETAHFSGMRAPKTHPLQKTEIGDTDHSRSARKRYLPFIQTNLRSMNWFPPRNVPTCNIGARQQKISPKKGSFFPKRYSTYSLFLFTSLSYSLLDLVSFLYRNFIHKKSTMEVIRGNRKENVRK